jgi:hypothetical protein
VIIPGYWTHHSKHPIQFILTVDDFRCDHVEHLLNIIKKDYKELTVDWTGTKYIGLTLDWDYQGGKVHFSMSGFVEKTLERFQHPEPVKPQNQPHPHIRPPNYGATQYATNEDPTPPVGPEQKKFIQQVSGTFMYLARSVDLDPIILTALSAIASQQSTRTERMLECTKQLLDYLASQEEGSRTWRIMGPSTLQPPTKRTYAKRY